MEENEGIHFGRFEIIGIGMEEIRLFISKIDRNAHYETYQFFMNLESNLCLLEKKLMREERRNKMKQQRLEKQFAWNAMESGTYADESGNRRSMRTKGKKKSYTEHLESDGDGDGDDVMIEDESEVYRPEGDAGKDEAEEQTVAVEEEDGED